MQETAPEVEIAVTPAPRRFWQRLDVLVGAIFVVVLLAAASTVDVVRNGYGLKGDEGTYTAATLSLAYDYDLTFERKDLERFWSFFTQGPDGAFFQKARGEYRLSRSFPFIRYSLYSNPPGDKLYFGKSFIYPVFVAPFVRVLGLNGFLVFNALLLAGVGICGYIFLRARCAGPAVAATFTLGFLGASIVPVYGVWLTPEIFNFAFVFFALFLWLYKEVAPAPDAVFAHRRARRAFDAFLFGRGSDIAAAVLLGLVTFSKVLYAPLIGPLVAWQLWKRRPSRASTALVAFALVAGGLFAVNAAVSGEISYQGGNRKVFYWPNMVFTTPEMTFESVGYGRTTNDFHEDVFDRNAVAQRAALNTAYFMVGRHSGLIPYFFPGVLAALLWLLRPREIRLWQALLALAAVACAAITVLWMPFTWSGGGGPPGNRYFIPVYPALFFLLPPLESLLVPLVAWAGGALFTAQLVMNPFFTAKYPHRNVDHGAVRFLPVELTMVNDLPIMLDVGRSNQAYGKDPTLFLYFLDENVFPPEPAGIWTKGMRRADIVVRVPKPLSSMRLTFSAPIPNHVSLSFDGRHTEVDLKPGVPMDVLIPCSEGVYSIHAYDYLLSVKTSNGMVPLLMEPGSKDRRFLGVLMTLQGKVR